MSTDGALQLMSQPMHQAELLISDVELERGADKFLRSYAKECENKTSKPVDTDSVLCSCVPTGLG